MRLLMISFDQTMLTEGLSKAGDTRERHIKYAKALRQYYPDASITVILRVPPSWSSQMVELTEGLTVYPVPCQRWAFVFRAINPLKKLLNRERFHVVTTQTAFDDGFLGVWVKRRFGIHLNVQMRSSFLDLYYWIKERPVVYRVFNILGKWVAHYADTIRVVSHGEKQRLEEKFPALRDRIFVLHPLINLKVFSEPIKPHEEESVRRILQQHGINQIPYLLFVGRLAIEKNLSTLLQAWALLHQKVREASLIIAGDGPLYLPLKKLAKKLHLDGCVVCLGNMSLMALRGWYAAARATVLPSLHEGFGKVIVESYLMGTPTIVTPFVSALELIQDGKTGFITKSFTNPEELAEKMLLLVSSPELAKDMGENGRAHIQNYLLPEGLYVKHLINIWEQTTSHHGMKAYNKVGST